MISFKDLIKEADVFFLLKQFAFHQLQKAKVMFFMNLFIVYGCSGAE